MKKRASIAAVVAAAAPVPALAKKHRHVKGCNTISCDNRIGARWARKHPKAHASVAVASWYGPGFFGHTTACGQTLTPQTFGVSNKVLACGTRVRLCVKRCVVAPVVDRGPYVGGRTFDLTAPVKNAIGAGSLGTVRYVVLG